MNHRRSMDKDLVPDGGYGWIIVVAFGANNIIVIPIMQGFSLLFRNIFADLHLSATDISTIVNVNSAFGLILGLFNGPLFKHFSYRQVSLISVLLMFIGFMLTSTANSFTEFILYYGVINSIGCSLNLTSFTLALNTYFNKRRNLASGLSSAVTGFGPVFMPILISFLISYYGVRGTALILSGFILHCFAGALLLHPVKWHYRKLEEERTIEKELELLNPPPFDNKMNSEQEKEDEDEPDEEYDINLVHGLEKVVIPTKRIENFENAGGGLFTSKVSLYEKAPDATWWRKSSNTGLPQYTSQYSIRQEKKSQKKESQEWISKIVKLFDLDLLQDPGYRTIWIGMSLAFTGEINFSLMTPLILGDLGWDVEETAKFMSSLAFADIIMRFISPFIGDAVKLPAKEMYMISLIFLILTRATLIFVNGWTQTLFACIVIGIAKGFRTVYMGLVIPSNVPLEKLASATGLQTVLNGLLLVIVGPVLGFIRDNSGSYNACIYFINSLSLVTVMLWTVEMILNRQKMKTQANNKSPES